MSSLGAACAGVIDVAADARAIWGLLMSSYMNLLLVAVPLGFAAQLLGWSAGLRFGLVSQSVVSTGIQDQLQNTILRAEAGAARRHLQWTTVLCP